MFVYLQVIWSSLVISEKYLHLPNLVHTLGLGVGFISLLGGYDILLLVKISRRFGCLIKPTIELFQRSAYNSLTFLNF